jgi:hypothetical protein
MATKAQRLCNRINQILGDIPGSWAEADGAKVWIVNDHKSGRRRERVDNARNSELAMILSEIKTRHKKG